MMAGAAGPSPPWQSGRFLEARATPPRRGMPSVSKVVIITGGSRGIGKATALALAAADYDVAVSFRQERRAADDVVQQVRARGRRALAVEADSAVEAYVVRLFAEAERELGAI